MPSIEFTQGILQGERRTLSEEDSLVIGRAGDADLVLLDPMISSRHAELWCSEGTWMIRDLDSSNGTLVNGETVVSGSHQLTEPNYGSSWMTADGVSIWDVGTFEVSGANVYSVALGPPDLSTYPSVKLTLDVSDAEGALMEGLTSANIYVINADGTGDREKIADSPARDWSPKW